MDSRIIINGTVPSLKAGCVRKDEPPKRGVVGIGNAEMYRRLSARVSEAEKKHPNFADGIYQGVGVIGEEYGELCQALNKGEGEERVMDEAFDLLCVAWRFCRGDWRMGDEKGYDYTAYDGKNVRMVKD